MRAFQGIALGCVLTIGAAVVGAQGGRGSASKIADGDWPNYNRDLAATRYSPLKQINSSNIGMVKEAWSDALSAPGGPNLSLTAVPIVIGGVMYVPAGNRVMALDGDTGQEVWAFSIPLNTAAPGRGRGGAPRPPNASTRGLGYWPGDGTLAPRILFMSGNRLWALDAATGKPAAGFGEEGNLNIGVGYGGTPTVYRNVAILGAASLEVPQGDPGNPRAFDVRTGQKVWEFQTVPRAGEKFNETWGDGWKNRGGTNMWAFSASIDVDRGVVYLPIAGPAANYYGGDRPGNNVYANSVVAVDAETGKYKWHFQTVHHDLWDSDTPSPGGLVEITQNGRRVPAIVSVGKTSYMFILDRTNGKPVFGVEERPVPKGDVPTEWYSPTQPFPVKPRPLSRVSFTKEDMVTAADTTPEHAAACQAMWDEAGGYRNDGPFTPFYYHEDGAPPKSTIQFPGGIGGVNWGGIAIDPATGYVFVQAHDTSLVGWVEKKKEGDYSFDAPGSHQAYDRASVKGRGPFFSFNAPVNGKSGASVPCQKGPWAKLVAVNANTGDIAWESVLGLNESLPKEKQLSGNAGSAGPTVTAGGLVFIGATNDRRFRAFDAKTGKEVWTQEIAKNANANPMTYQGKSGKQYVAIVAGDTVHAYALP